MILTLRQYEAEQRRRCLAEYADLTGREYDECYPPDSRTSDWIEALLAAAAAGAPLTRVALDDVARRRPHVLRHLLKEARAGRVTIPDGYLPPETRAANAAADEERRAQRRRRTA